VILQIKKDSPLAVAYKPRAESLSKMKMQNNPQAHKAEWEEFRFLSGFLKNKRLLFKNGKISD
jgi:hypothetical protein